MEWAQNSTGIYDGLTLVMMRVRRSARATLRKAVLDEGLSQNEIEVLLILKQGCCNTARDMSRLRGMPRSLVSKSVDQLIKRGYVEARQDQRDRRVTRLQLLPPAQATVERLEQVREEYFSRLCRGITGEEAEAFRSMVNKMAKNLEELLPEGDLGEQEG